jgi:hypothetical protein
VDFIMRCVMGKQFSVVSQGCVAFSRGPHVGRPSYGQLVKEFDYGPRSHPRPLYLVPATHACCQAEGPTLSSAPFYDHLLNLHTPRPGRSAA